MASYAFATLQARQTLQELWEQGKTVKDMAEALDVPLSTLYTELRRGRSGVRLPDQRLQYDATPTPSPPGGTPWPTVCAPMTATTPPALM